MEFAYIVLIVSILYYRTKDYFYLIDDYVLPIGYYNVGIMPAPVEIYSMKPSKLMRLWMVSLHCINCFIVYLLWGFLPSLLLAIHPMSVWVTAWRTGSYYSTAAFFTLVAYYIVHTFPNIFGSVIGMWIFNAGINSTVCPIAFPFLGVFEPWLFTFGLMVLWLLKSDRWSTAMKERQKLYAKPVRFDWRRPISMVKVVARYTFQAIIPVNLFMFVKFGDNCRDDNKTYEEMHRCDVHFWASFALVTNVFILGLILDPFATCWFFILIGLHSQFGLTGQFYAQRYLYLPMIGLLVVLTKAWLELGSPVWLLAAYVAYLIYRTWKFIPVFSDMETFARNDISQMPPYSMAFNNLAAHISKLSDGRLEEIEALFYKALSANPNEWATHLNLAKLYILQSQWEKGLPFMKKAYELVDEPNTKEMFRDYVKKIQIIIKEKKQS